MKEIRIGDTVEVAIERSDYPPERVREILGNEVVAVLGYGVQGRGQSLNMRDNGVRVIIGQRKGSSTYERCLEDGWKPGETLFDPEEAAARGTIVQYLLSDAGQKEMWPRIRPHLTAGKALYFSHGFAIGCMPTVPRRPNGVRWIGSVSSGMPPSRSLSACISRSPVGPKPDVFWRPTAVPTTGNSWRRS
jgi:hypothetical protein